MLFVFILAIVRFQGFVSEEDEREEKNLVEMEEHEMDWDDSAMTITVNPMDVSGCLVKPLSFIYKKKLSVDQLVRRLPLELPVQLKRCASTKSLQLSK